MIFFFITGELRQGPELCGGAGWSVVQLVQHNLPFVIKEVRAEARDGCCWATNVVPAKNSCTTVVKC